MAVGRVPLTPWDRQDESGRWPVRCPQCDEPFGVSAPRFCPHCGTKVGAGPHGTVWSRVGRLLLPLAPLAALAGSFAPWVVVRGLGAAGLWDVYRFGPFAWLWLVGDVGALGVAVGRLMRVPWVLAGWALFGALSCGVGLSGLVFVRVAGTISHVLGVPIPVRLGYGVEIFVAATVLWVALAAQQWAWRTGARLRM